MLLDLLQKMFEQGNGGQCDCANIQREEGHIQLGLWELQIHQDDIPYHDDLGKNNRQNTEGRDKHRRRAVRFHAGQRDNWCHICSEAGDRETPGNAEGTATGVYLEKAYESVKLYGRTCGGV